jgi:ABC-type phosphate/phosphonate transport system substrate-binding protein
VLRRPIHYYPETTQTIFSGKGLLRGIISALILPLALVALSQNVSAQTAKSPAVKSIALGLISDTDASAVQEHFREFVRYIAGRLSAGSENEAKVVIAPTIFDMAKLLEQRRVDFYMESPYATYLINYVHGVGKTLLRRWKRGQAEYQSLIITKREGGIKQLSDLRGKSIVFKDTGSTSGYLLPKIFLLRRGFKLVQKRDYDPFASPDEITYFFAYSGRRLLESVLTQQAAAAAISDDDYAGLDKKEKAEITVLDQTEKLVRHLVSVRSDFPPLWINSLEKVLLSMHEEEAGSRVLYKTDQTTKFDRIPGGEEALRKKLLDIFLASGGK